MDTKRREWYEETFKSTIKSIKDEVDAWDKVIQEHNAIGIIYPDNVISKVVALYGLSLRFTDDVSNN